MFKLPGNITQVYEQAKKFQEEFVKLKAEAESKEVDASAGGGMVRVKVNGGQVVTVLEIEKELLTSGDAEMIQDLVRAAVNEGIRKSQELIKEQLKTLTGGLPIPGFS